jgi:hypothetical protein
MDKQTIGVLAKTISETLHSLEEIERRSLARWAIAEQVNKLIDATVAFNPPPELVKLLPTKFQKRDDGLATALNYQVEIATAQLDAIIPYC